MMATGDWPLPAFILTHKPSIVFPLICPTQKGQSCTLQTKILVLFISEFVIRMLF